MTGAEDVEQGPHAEAFLISATFPSQGGNGGEEEDQPRRVEHAPRSGGRKPLRARRQRCRTCWRRNGCRVSPWNSPPCRHEGSRGGDVEGPPQSPGAALSPGGADGTVLASAEEGPLPISPSRQVSEGGQESRHLDGNSSFHDQLHGLFHLAFPRRCFSITRERYCANMTLPPSNKKRRGRETCPAPLPRLGYKKGRERRSLVGPASTAVKCALFIGSRALWSPAAGYLARHHQFWLSLFRIMTTASRKRIGEKIPRPRPVCQQGNFYLNPQVRSLK